MKLHAIGLLHCHLHRMNKHLSVVFSSHTVSLADEILINVSSAHMLRANCTSVLW